MLVSHSLISLFLGVPDDCPCHSITLPGTTFHAATIGSRASADECNRKPTHHIQIIASHAGLVSAHWSKFGSAWQRQQGALPALPVLPALPGVLHIIYHLLLLIFPLQGCQVGRRVCLTRTGAAYVPNSLHRASFIHGPMLCQTPRYMELDAHDNQSMDFMSPEISIATAAMTMT